ncbi:MAG: ATP-binding protein [Ignavibacteria bacterium]|nr:ATP-binding protein [Ignavibacteria bacterium]
MGLAIMEEMPFENAKLQLEQGDAMFLYTDGVTEAMDIHDNLYTDPRLEKILQKLNANASITDIMNGVISDVKLFATGAPQADDITVLTLRYQGRVFTTLTVQIANNRPEIARLSGIIEEFLASNDVPMNVGFAIDLALDELLTNIISYGFPDGGKHTITIQIDVSTTDVKVIISDEGVPFNPLEQEEVDTTLSIEDREIGGLGIHLVKKTMNHLGYEREENRNVLTLVKGMAG